MIKRLLLTGISGSIGCHFLAHFMHNTTWEIVGIASFRHKGLSDRIIEIMKNHSEWATRLTVIIHDLTAPLSALTIKKIGYVDYIINMASLSDVFDSIENPVPFIQNNINVILNMLEYARIAKPKVFIQISTDEVYGPVENKFRKGVKEWDAIVPSNPYAASKAAQEVIAISYWRTYNVPLIITNTMNNFGEMQQHNKFPVMVQRWIAKDQEILIHGEEGQIGSRSYIHSRNFADAILFLLRNTKPTLHSPGKADRPDRYNIAGDRQLDNLELSQLIAKLMGKELKYRLEPAQIQRPGHDPHYALDDKKLKSLGWRSPIYFEESLKNTIEWQATHQEWIE